MCLKMMNKEEEEEASLCEGKLKESAASGRPRACDLKECD